jgi:uncharacterized membrane protein YbaN (DUF454 family)
MRALWVTLGSIFVVIGAIGVVLPLIPTTPFLLLATACYARGSQRLDDWLHGHPRFGPTLKAWRDHRAVPWRAKLLAAALLTFSVAYAWGCPVSGVPQYGQVGVAVVAVGVISFLITRPSRVPALDS